MVRTVDVKPHMRKDEYDRPLDDITYNCSHPTNIKAITDLLPLTGERKTEMFIKQINILNNKCGCLNYQSNTVWSLLKRFLKFT